MTPLIDKLTDDIIEALFLNGYISGDYLKGARKTIMGVYEKHLGASQKSEAPLNDFLVHELPAMSEKEYFDEINRE